MTLKGIDEQGCTNPSPPKHNAGPNAFTHDGPANDARPVRQTHLAPQRSALHPGARPWELLHQLHQGVDGQAEHQQVDPIFDEGALQHGSRPVPLHRGHFTKGTTVAGSFAAFFMSG